jgi:glycosyltransferase involved in cell wall biosynthesis
MNERIPSSPPLIKPVDNTVNRPLWSVMIPTYNCSAFLRQTLESVLQQAPGPEKMQIEVIDDASTDADIEQLVADIGKGRIGFFRQPVNQGSLRNFETCLNRSKGEWVHILHGDDVVNKGFYNEIESLFLAYPEAGAAYTGFWHVNEAGEERYPNEFVLSEPGIINDWLTIIAQGQKLQPPAIVVKRSVYEKLGGFFGVHYGEDWEMWVRIAANYPMAHSPERLAQYRVHSNNISSRYFLSGQHIKDIAFVIKTIQQYLPPDQRKKLINSAKRNWSQYFARTSDMVYGGYKSPSQALVQAKMAFNLHKNKTSLFFLLKTWLKLTIRYKMS